MRDFDDLYREYAAQVFRMALRYVGRPEIAEEIMSETFLALYEHHPDFEQLALPAWLFTVAKRRAVDYWRRQLHEQSLDEETQERAAPEAGADVMEIIRACGSLNAAHRACVILRYVHGMSRAEIAARTGLDVNQVKGNLQYALKLLRDELGKGAASPRK
jgi:RNA polymerase sigma-70 factor (ECF subfamily)